MTTYKAYLRVKRLGDGTVISSIGINNLSERHVERVMLGLLRNMDTDNYYIDDSEVDEARGA